MIELALTFQLLEVFPHYHQWLDTTWEVKFMKGPFIGRIYSKKLHWEVKGIDFASETYEYPSKVTLGAARLGLTEELNLLE